MSSIDSVVSTFMPGLPVTLAHCGNIVELAFSPDYTFNPIDLIRQGSSVPPALASAVHFSGMTSH